MQTVDKTTRPPQQPDGFAPPQAPTPPGEKQKSRKRLILGLLAAAGVLGILGFLAVLATVALIFFFAIGSTSGEQADPQPAAPRPAEDGEQQPAEAAPGEGSGLLDDIVQDRVGEFALRQSDALPVAAGSGAIEARELLYASPDGTEVVHRMTETESPDAADRVLRAQTESYAAEGYRQAEQFEVTDREDGQRLGSGVAFADPSGAEEVVHWTNDVGYFAVTTPEGYGFDFYNNLEY